MTTGRDTLGTKSIVRLKKKVGVVMKKLEIDRGGVTAFLVDQAEGVGVMIFF